MKVLLSAHACNPESTSECIVGWRCLLAVASRHEVWLLTAERNREALERARNNGSLPSNVRLHFAGKPFVKNRNPMAAKLQEWPYYSDVLKAARTVAVELHREVGFHLVHHATFATWRVTVPYGELGIPFVIGPIGGGEIFDLRYSSYMSWQARIFEWIRNCATLTSIANTGVRKTFREVSVVISANAETSAIVGKFVRSTERIRNLLVTSFPKEVIAKYAVGQNKDWHGILKLAGGGTCEGRKGVLLVMKSLLIVKDRGIPFHYTFAGSGPEAEYLRKKRDEMGLTSEVDILPNLKREEYLEHLEKTHIYLLPSLRDNSPVALMEAMLARCVPIVAACNGPAVIVTSECGFPCPIDNPRSLIEHMADIVCEMHHNREKLKALGEAASLRISRDFNDTQYGEGIESAYVQAMNFP
jgi:glycosyltransferase involved in cell wall biosynthesis